MSNKLNPIYVALDNHQYSRAIKLCLSLDPSNLLGQALMALAYAKNAQQTEALRQLACIFPLGFPELRRVLIYIDATTVKQAPETAPSAPAKKGGKKKKGGGSAPKPKTTVSPQMSVSPPSLDMVELLDNPPALPDNWDELPPVSDATPTDSAFLGTISMTLSQLSLPLTAYQLYCWAASAKEDIEFVRRAIGKGLAVVLAPQYTQLASKILANIQVLCLQLSRLEQRHYGSSSAMAWAAQTALWQLDTDIAPAHASDDKNHARMAMLPRLTESMASKLVIGQNSSPEEFRLYMRSLAFQQKWAESLAAIRESAPESESSVNLKLLEAEILEKMERYDDTIKIVEQELLSVYPDNWDFWKIHMRCTLAAADGNLESLKSCTDLAKSLGSNRGYPLRGPHLVAVDVASRELGTVEERLYLRECLQDYANTFAGSMNCAFADLRPYTEKITSMSTDQEAEEFLLWLSNFQNEPTDDNEERRTSLRRFIFATQMTYSVLAAFPEMEGRFLPDWKRLLKVWSDTKSLEPEVQLQKESRLSDELIILAAQQLTRGSNPSPENSLRAIIMLEAAMDHSPSNAYLKMFAMSAYAQVDAASRSMELFSDLMIKHIQYESCSHLILHALRAGGLYHEVITVCRQILQFQKSSSQEAADYTVRAMENSAFRKADEFMRFQRNKMNYSLTAFEAKGLVLNCAPMFQMGDVGNAPLGTYHGIVGMQEDFTRASSMIAECRNPFGAFSVLATDDQLHLRDIRVCDNRDLSLFEKDILNPRQFEDAETIVDVSVRTGHRHGLLIRACLCIESAVGLKKGKVVKPTETLKKRCRSLDSYAEGCLRTIESSNLPEENNLFLTSMIYLCKAISAVSGGPADLEKAIDSVVWREERGSDFVQLSLSAVQSAGEIISSFSRVAPISCLLPDFVVPLLAAFRMCAHLFDMFGWGPKRRHTKLCAKALVDFAVDLQSITSGMRKAVEEHAFVDFSDAIESFVPGLDQLVSEDMVRSATEITLESQKHGLERVRSVLDEVYGALNEFDVQRDSEVAL